MTFTAKCLYCPEQLTFQHGIGWTHPGGGTYMQRCDECGYKAARRPSPKACPSCGAVRAWRDDHCATPGALTEGAPRGCGSNEATKSEIPADLSTEVPFEALDPDERELARFDDEGGASR